MLHQTHPLRTLASLAIALGASIAGAVAQDTTATDTATGTATLDTMLVTGSNIPTSEEVGPLPVKTISREEIQRSAYRTAAEIIKNQPVANAGGVPISNNATGFTPGATSISLRGLGPEATLVLIDGKRVATYPQGQNGSSSFIDLNSIPASAVESIEILKDGASTVYGADAVAGVVNIKLRKDYEGVEVNTSYGNTTDKDSSEFTSSLLFGVVTEKTRIVGGMNYYHRNSIFNKDRDYSKVPPFLSSNSSPINLQLSGAAANEAGLPGGPFDDQDSMSVHPPEGISGVAAASAYLPGRSRYNFNQFSGSFPEMERYGGYVSMEHDLFEKRATLYSLMSYQHSYTRNELAPGASGNFRTAGQVTVAIPSKAPGNAFYFDPTTGEVVNGASPDVAPGAYNPFNPFQQVFSDNTRFRLAEFGNRIYKDESDSFLGRIGLKGQDIAGKWGYDVGANYSRIQATSTTSQASASRFNRILNANDPIFDPTSSEFIGTTTPYNPFGDYRVPVAGNTQVVKYATVQTKDVNTSELLTIDATISNYELFQLPGGYVGVAFGGQFRKEQLDQNPDQENIDGDIIGSSPAATTDGGRKSYGVYAETNIPIFGGDFKLPGFHSLDLNASVRYEEFKNNGTNVVVPKGSLRWQPFDESLTIRGSVGRGFRQPSLYELFSSPGVQGLQSINGTAGNNPEVPVVTNGNPNLGPEDSTAINIGFTFTPKFVPNLTFSVDFWQIDRTAQVVAPNPQDVYDRFIKGNFLPGESVIINPGGNKNDANEINIINTQFNSTAHTRVKGVDLGLSYVLPTKFGTFTSLSEATYLNSYKQALAVNEPLKELIGKDATGTADDGYIKWKARQTFLYEYQAFKAAFTINYTGGFADQRYIPDSRGELSAGAGPFRLNKAGDDFEVQTYDIHSQTTLDVQLSYTFGLDSDEVSGTIAGYSKAGKSVAPEAPVVIKRKPWYADTTVTVGVNNVTDETPPSANALQGNTTNYPGNIYTSEGRFAYVSLTKKF